MRTLEEWLELEKLVAGKGTREVADILGCTVGQAYHIRLRCANRDYPPPGYPKRHLTTNKVGYNRHKARKSEKLRPMLEEGIGFTLEEVGQVMGITRERVRQLYVEAKIDRKFKDIRWDRLLSRVTKESLEQFTDGQRTQLEAIGGLGVSIHQLYKIASHYGVVLKFRHQVNRELYESGHRKCVACREIKPFAEFYSNSLNLHVQPVCKVCAKATVREHYRKCKGRFAVLMLGDRFLNRDGSGWTSNLRDASIFTHSQRCNTRLYWFPEGTKWFWLEPEIAKTLTKTEEAQTIRASDVQSGAPQQSRSIPLPTNGAEAREGSIEPGHNQEQRPVDAEGAPDFRDAHMGQGGTC